MAWQKGFEVLTSSPSTRIAGLIGVSLIAMAARAQCVERWVEPSTGCPGLSGLVSALTTFDDGRGEAVYAVGNFRYASVVGSRGIARWDGKTWEGVGGGLNGNVVIAIPFNGRLVVGGRFSQTAAGVPMHYLAAWDGQTWQPMGDENTFNQTVYCLAVVNGELYAGGTFSKVGTEIADGLARWDGVAWRAVPGYSALSAGAVYSISSFDGELVTGVSLGSGLSVRRLHAGQWEELAKTTETGAAVYGIAEWRGDLYVAGPFTQIANLHGLSVARWSGGTWQSVQAPDAGWGMCILPETDRLIVGRGEGLYAWDGSAWQALHTAAIPPQVNWCVRFHGELVAGCNETRSLGSEQTSYISHLTPQGWASTASGFNYEPGSLARFRGDLYVGGLTFAGNPDVLGIARRSGDSWEAVGSGLGGGASNQAVSDLRVYGDRLLAGGSFTAAGGLPAPGLAAWDGHAWGSLGLPDGSTVSKLGEIEGDLVCAGSFPNSPTTKTPGVRRLAGDAWTSLGSGMNGPISSLATYAGSLYAAGYFTIADAAPAPYIARWDGAHWLPVGDPAHTWTVKSMNSMAVVDGKLVVGGDFSMVNGVAAADVAVWDGTAWSAASPDIIPASTGAVQRLAADGTDIIVAGSLRLLGSTAGAPLVRISGGVATPFSPLTSATGLLIEPDVMLVSGESSQPGLQSFHRGVFELKCLCPSDINADGFVTGDDLDLFAVAFETAAPEADVDSNGFVTGDDLDLFTSTFLAGC